MNSTGIYVRVSTDEQAREGYSIRAQEEKLRAYAMLKDWDIYSVYSDEGISGKDIDGRPAIKQLITDITSGKVKNVLVYKIDRLTRSTKNLIELVELFNNHHCAFNSLQESIDTGSATGRMFLKIIGIFAEFERENLAERVRLGIERKAKEGYAIGNFSSSFGYSRENGNRIQAVEEEEAATVRRIFDMYLNGNCSYRKIVDTLNAENVSTKFKKKWAAGTIRRILSNPNYIGKVRYSIEDATRYFEVDGHHKAIIDETTYYQVQEKISKIERLSHTKHPTSGVYFCGILYCHICGAKYSTHWNYKGKWKAGERRPAAYPSYRCRDTFNKDGKDCTAKIIAHTKVERAFAQYIAHYEDFNVIDDAKADNPQTDNSAEISNITAEVRQIEKKTAEIMSLFVSNTIDFTTYQGMVKISNERRGKLEVRLILLENAQKSKEVIYTPSDIVSNFRDNWCVLDNEQRQQFLQKFVKKIVARCDTPKGVRNSEVIIDEIVFNEF